VWSVSCLRGKAKQALGRSAPLRKMMFCTQKQTHLIEEEGGVQGTTPGRWGTKPLLVSKPIGNSFHFSSVFSSPNRGHRKRHSLFLHPPRPEDPCHPTGGRQILSRCSIYHRRNYQRHLALLPLDNSGIPFVKLYAMLSQRANTAHNQELTLCTPVVTRTSLSRSHQRT